MWNILKSVSEVIAPSSRTSLDIFKEHWRAIRSFYIDERVDVEEGQIPQHLSSMLQLILEEETEFTGGHGPCLDFFFREKILEFICAFGMRDVLQKPPGMRKYTLTIVTQLLNNTRIPLLNQMSIHQPLSKLVRTCWCEDQTKIKNEMEEFVGLVATIMQKLGQQPEIVGFFLSGVIEEVDQKRIQNGESFVHGENLFPLFDVLKDHVTLENSIGERSRKAILTAVDMEIPEVDDFIVLKSDLCPVVNQCLLYTYQKSMQDHDEQSVSIIPSRLVCFVHFVNGLMKRRGRITDIMTNIVKENLLREKVSPNLSSTTSGSEAVKSIKFVTQLIELSSSQYMKEAIVGFCVSNSNLPESKNAAVNEQEAVQRDLISRIDTPDDSVSLAALQLWSSVISTCSQQAITGLVLRNLLSYNHLEPMKQNSKSDEEAAFLVHNSIARFMEIPTYTDQSFIAQGYETYLIDAQNEVKDIKAKISLWKSLDITRESPSEFFEGYFLQALFRRLNQMPVKQFEYNLVVTSIFTQLARFPIPQMHSYFLNPDAGLKENVPSLFGSLKSVSSYIKQKAESIPNFSLKVLETRKEMSSTTALKNNDADKLTTNLVFATILLEEFCKELAATLQAKAVMEILSVY